MLNMGELETLQRGRCPDCNEADLRLGPRGGNSQNIACGACGSEFNVGRHGVVIVMGHRNTPKGKPDYQRLRDVFGVVLPGTPNQGPVINGIVMRGPFSAADLHDLMATLRSIDQRNPSATFTFEALAPGGTIEEGKRLMELVMPEMEGRTPVSRSTMERFTDAERQLLIVLVTQAHVNIMDDPELAHANDEVNHILSMLYGTDTVIWADRAYPSRKK